MNKTIDILDEDLNYIDDPVRRGDALRPEVQAECKRRYVHRFTGDHRPGWAHDGDKVQFKDDADWLANTFFTIKKDGTLDGRVLYCESHPTWPEGRSA